MRQGSCKFGLGKGQLANIYLGRRNVILKSAIANNGYRQSLDTNDNKQANKFLIIFFYFFQSHSTACSDSKYKAAIEWMHTLASQFAPASFAALEAAFT